MRTIARYFDGLNTFYWGPRQYDNLPSSIRTALTNQTFDPVNLTTNNYKLGWTRHWLRGENNDTNIVLASNTLSVERSPSSESDGSLEGLLTFYDYNGKGAQSSTGTEYAGTTRLPR